MHNTNFRQIVLFHLQQCKLFSVLTISLLILLFISCGKEKDEPGTASLTIVNAMVGSRPLVANFKSEGPILYKRLTPRFLLFNNFSIVTNQFNSFSGNQRIRFFQYPDTTEKDTPLFDLQLDLPVASVNSLFLTGTRTAPDTLFTKDQIPYFMDGDSAMAIRFINLMPGSSPVSINRKDSIPGSELTALPYKRVSEFKQYEVKRNITNYVFEFRDTITGELIAEYNTYDLFKDGPNPWVYRSMTIVLLGEPGGTGASAPSTLLVQHFTIF